MSGVPAMDSGSGPAIVEERESTTVIGPGAMVSVDAEGNLTVEIEGAHDH